jgi:superoxide dismutase, Fe-Mn family
VHLGKHHQAYIDGANALLKSMTKRFESAVDVVRFARDNNTTALFEQSAQALNHGFFWTCHQAAGLTRPQGNLETAINGAFTDFDGFVAAAIKAGKSRVGSGWIWVVTDMQGVVSLEVTTDADTCLDSQTHVALLVCDIWEHAFYLDHKSDKAGWITGFFGQLADWKLAAARYEAAVIMEPSDAKGVQ